MLFILLFLLMLSFDIVYVVVLISITRDDWL